MQLHNTFHGFLFPTFVTGFIALCFVIVFGSILFVIVKAARQWAYNSAQPLLTAPARVIGKREEHTRHRHHHNQNDNLHWHDATSTSYHVAFEKADGERMELKVKGNDYGILFEGDTGELSYQGTWFKGFRRTPEKASGEQEPPFPQRPKGTS